MSKQSTLPLDLHNWRDKDDGGGVIMWYSRLPHAPARRETVAKKAGDRHDLAWPHRHGGHQQHNASIFSITLNRY